MAGGVPIMLPLFGDKNDLDQLIEMCDGFLFAGGHDVSPEIYKPILGICRGIINLYGRFI